MQATQPIGVFDSGIGGLTVVKQLRQLLPQERLIYFGDTARAPYGSRPERQIYEFTDQMMKFMKLCNIKLGVVACNTITVLGIERIGAGYPFALIGNNSAANAALAASRSKRIGVIATEMTIRKEYHRKALQAIDPAAEVVCVATPLLAPLVESGQLSGKTARAAVRASLAPFTNQPIDALILGCTHYPYLRELIEQEVGSGVTVIDPAAATVHEVQSYLKRHALLNSGGNGGGALYFSADAERCRMLAQTLFDTRSLLFRELALDPWSEEGANSQHAAFGARACQDWMRQSADFRQELRTAIRN